MQATDRVASVVSSTPHARRRLIRNVLPKKHMFIAHLPAGYLLASAGESKVAPEDRRLVFWCLLAGSIFPDLDMFYFYFVDGRQTHHHLYWPHLPVFWLVLLGAGSLVSVLLRKTRVTRAMLSSFAGVMLHLVLDTPVGGIAWLYPYNSDLLYLMKVPAGRSWWVWNFIFHWTFLIEMIICVAAFITWIRRRSRKAEQDGAPN